MQLDLDGVYSLLADRQKNTPSRKAALVSGVAYYSLGMQHDEAACDVVKTQVLNPRN
jgi:hypothetical protein